MIHKFDGYGSHIMILDKLQKLTHFSSILEFGGGEFSTSFFMKIPGATVITIESQDHDWYEKIKKINPNTLWIPDHQKVLEYAMENVSHRDLVFLDTHQDLRYQLVHIVHEYTDIIGLHDSETTLYNYHNIQLDWTKWFYADYVLYRPWTGLLSTSKVLLKEILEDIPGMLCTDMPNKTHISDI